MRDGWENIDPNRGHVWRHESGAVVMHCGDESNPRPWFGVAPDGELLLNPTCNVPCGFRGLKTAMRCVELRAGEWNDNNPRPGS